VAAVRLCFCAGEIYYAFKALRAILPSAIVTNREVVADLSEEMPMATKYNRSGLVWDSCFFVAAPIQGAFQRAFGYFINRHGCVSNDPWLVVEQLGDMGLHRLEHALSLVTV
jgi:hypothetical protein